MESCLQGWHSNHRHCVLRKITVTPHTVFHFSRKQGVQRKVVFSTFLFLSEALRWTLKCKASKENQIPYLTRKKKKSRGVTNSEAVSTGCGLCPLYFHIPKSQDIPKDFLMRNAEMCRKWLPSFIDISFLLQGVEMCVFLILNVVMVTGLLGCCFLHPTKAAVLCVWCGWWGAAWPPSSPRSGNSLGWISGTGGGMGMVWSHSYHS